MAVSICLARRIVVPALIALVVVAAQPAWAVDVGDKAPAFKVDNLDGRSSISLSNFSGKPTLVVFWVSWCPHCRNEMPVLQKVYTDLKGKGARVVGLSVDDDIDDARRLVRETRVTFPNGYAGTENGMRVARAYGVRGVPALYFIDRQGMVREAIAGEATEAEVRKGFAKLGVR